MSLIYKGTQKILSVEYPYVDKVFTKQTVSNIDVKETVLVRTDIFGPPNINYMPTYSDLAVTKNKSF